jgi:hypothetical protein
VLDEPWLHLLAGDWDTPAHQVAARIAAKVNPLREGEH